MFLSSLRTYLLEGVADATMTFANAEPEPDLVVPKASEVQARRSSSRGDATAMMPGIDLHHQDADVDDLEASDGTTPNTTRTSPGPEQSHQRRNLWIPFFIVICVASLLIIIIWSCGRVDTKCSIQFQSAKR
jgi:hypothetical protein